MADVSFVIKQGNLVITQDDQAVELEGFVLRVRQGPPGPQGIQGGQGIPGEGVPEGGSTGQVMAKLSGDDYDTGWVNVTWDDIDDKPSTFAPSAHTHPISDVTNLQDELDDKADESALTAHTSNTSNPHGVTKSQVGLGNVDNTSDANKPISSATQAALDAKASTASLSAHTGNTSNPHAVTKSQVGLGNVDNTSDANKPISTATQAALDTKASTSALSAHTGNTSNPHGVTKSQVGLGNVDNTSDANKPISTDTQAALDAKADLVGGEVPTSQLGSGTADNTKFLRGDQTWAVPAGSGGGAPTDATYVTVTANSELTDEVLLSSVHGYGVAASRPAAAAGNAGFIYYATDTKVFSRSNGSTWDALELDIDSISGLQTALDGKLGTSAKAADSELLDGNDSTHFATASDLTSHESDTANPHSVTKTQVGLGNVTDHAQLKASDLDTDGTLAANSDTKIASQKAVKTYADTKASASTVSSHIADTANPHGVTKTQVGLSNVDNTSDLNKPISTATQAALDDKADDSDLTAHTGNTSNPHGVTKSQVGLGNVTNDAQLRAADLDTDSTMAANSDTKIPSQKAVKTALDGKLGTSAKAADSELLDGNDSTHFATASDLTSHESDTANPHSVTKSQVGLGNVTDDAQLKIASNLSDLASAATARANLAGPVIIPLGEVSKAGTIEILYMPKCSLQGLHMTGTYTWTLAKDTGSGYSNIDTGSATESPFAGGDLTFNAGDKFKITISGYSAAGALTIRGIET